jgi:hypothetical protein
MDFDGGDAFYVDFGGSRCDMDLSITEPRQGRFRQRLMAFTNSKQDESVVLNGT